MHSRFNLRACLVASAAIMAAPAAVHGQAYPSKPVRLVAPFPPGGTSDVVARITAQKLGDGLGRQVIVENRGGASGMIGYEVVVKSPPDGYTLLLSSMGGLVTNQFLFKKLPFDPIGDFAHISQLATAAQVLVVHPAVPARSVKELVALAKAKPGQLNFGTGGKGTTQHIVTEVFKNATGAQMVHVPYKGGGLAVADLIGGQIDLMFADMAAAVPHVKANKLRALAVTSEARSPALPDVPGMAQAGVKEPFPQTWWGLSAPRGTPAAIVSRINTEIGQFMAQPDVKERFASFGLSPLHSSPERMIELVKTGSARMEKIVKAAGIQPE